MSYFNVCKNRSWFASVWAETPEQAFAGLADLIGADKAGEPGDWDIAPAPTWVVEGRGQDGRWSREYVEAGGDAVFVSSADAEDAADDLARVCGFDPADLRVRRQDTVSNVPAVKRRWLSVKIDRHADFGGGTIVADIPDTEYHRRFYADRIVRVWSQLVESE